MKLKFKEVLSHGRPPFSQESDSDTVSGGLKGKPTISMAAGFGIGFGGDVRILGCSIFAEK